MYKIGFDSERYLHVQSQKIMERVERFGNKLYLEVGGKLFDDLHASRVLPGFESDGQLYLFKKLADKTEIIITINASDIDQRKLQADRGISYVDNLIQMLDFFKLHGLYVSSVVVTRYKGQETVINFKHRLECLGVNVYFHYFIEGYPFNIPMIIGKDGFDRNEYVRTTRPLVVVTACGAYSGKMATCLSQLYHDFKRKIKSGYAKFEKFPLWSVPINHPINLAYEAATTDINDALMIDPFHLEAYGIPAVSYNRDIEAFPILNELFKQIWGESPYKSPTDMGVNMFKECIVNDEICQYASKQEIIRRYYKALCDEWMYSGKKSEIKKLEFLMKKAGISINNRTVVQPAHEKARLTNTPCVAIELTDGRVITGKTTPLLSAASATLLNALKILAGISDEVNLILPRMIKPIQKFNIDFFGNQNPHLQINEVLITLLICTTTNPLAEIVLEQIPKLKNCEAHSTEILSQAEIDVFHKLCINITCEPGHKKISL